MYQANRLRDVTGEVAIRGGQLASESVANAGDGIQQSVHLQKPIALEPEAAVAIREGNRTIGSRAVTKATSWRKSIQVFEAQSNFRWTSDTILKISRASCSSIGQNIFSA